VRCSFFVFDGSCSNSPVNEERREGEQEYLIEKVVESFIIKVVVTCPQGGDKVLFVYLSILKGNY
jgi:hypothetical protein